MENISKMLSEIGGKIKSHRENLPIDNRFNVFNLLRQGHEEVNLHSRFLAELLNPRGRHGIGTDFLQLFIENIRNNLNSLPVDFNLSKARVRREFKNIDLLLDDEKYWIIIENKIYAGDQPQQIFRYHEEALAHKQQPVIFYLTLDGHQPAAHSVEGLPQDTPVYLLTYTNHIDEWLTACLERTKDLPKLHHTILQYQELVRLLTGKTMSNEKNLILSILTKEDNAQHAATIVRQWNHLRHHAEFQFWGNLESCIQAEGSFQTLAEAHFTSEKISRAINLSKNKNTGYGLKFKLGMLDELPITFKINRGDSVITYGITCPKNLSNENAVAKLSTVNTELRQCFPNHENAFWLAYKKSESNLNFEAFSNATTVQLANDSERLRLVSLFWDEVKLFASECILQLQQNFGNRFHND